MWKQRSRKQRSTCSWHQGCSNLITTIAFSSDGLCLALGFDDGTLQLWDATSSTLIATLKGHPNRVTIIAFSPDGLCLASGSRDHTVQLWDGASIATLEGHSHPVYELAFSSDGHTLVSSRGPETFTWDLTSQPPYQPASGSSSVTPELSVGWSPLFQYVQDSWIQVKWKEDGHNHTRYICCLPPHYISSCKIASSPQTHFQIAVGCQDGRVFILDLPHDTFNGYFMKEPVDLGLLPTVATPHSSLTSHDTHLMNEETPLINHNTLHNRHTWGFRKFLQWFKVIFCC
jgi:WD40 repeat protein